MAEKLKTGWLCIGRSGMTVDGRDIQPEWLRQAAKNYKQKLFTGLIWPDHIRWFNMGKVLQLKTQDNPEGGVDLFAILEPNEFYISINKAGQRLFTSMELMPNFRDTGEFYLTGLAATDNPASAATTEVRLSASDRGAVIGDFVENRDFNFSTSTDDEASLFERLVDLITSKNIPEADDMDQKQFEQLDTGLNALAEQMKTFTAQLASKEEPAGGEPAPKDEQISLTALGEKLDALTARVEAFAVGDKPPAGEEEPTVDAEKFAKLQQDFDALQTKFSAALKPQSGTDAGEHGGDATDHSGCL